MCTHSREPIQEVESPCLPHDSQTSFGLRTSACLEFFLSECPKANRKAKFWMKNAQIQKFLIVELVKPKVSTFLNNIINIKKPHYQSTWKKNSTSEQAYPHEELVSLWIQQETKEIYA